ncbi:HNH endonuclease [Micromonospora sp. CB01531]|uniref:HNH endonuclease n=1 Tax=Micromonospora sp. CB01531 TaxID=1718947 RepID=UPI0013019A26|nr:HNH endonuclease [Micromonospora sp. CB01531]
MARPSRPCGDCKTTTVTWPRIYCPNCAGVRRLEHYQRKNLKRRAGGTRIMSIRELAERDRWRCHLCRRRVSRTLRYPHPRSASRDHLIPVADGGTNDPANLALAHWDCNVRRRTGGTVQLQLVV